MPGPTSFTNRIDVTGPTSIWYFKSRYIAYDGGFNLFTGIYFKFYQNFGIPYIYLSCYRFESSCGDNTNNSDRHGSQCESSK